MLALALRGHYHISKTEFFGFGTGVLAYTLGMRHAFDADHIAAIDNTTRKLIQDGKRPLSVGLLLLARPLDDRLRPRRPLELRHPGAQRRGAERQLGAAPLDRASSAPSVSGTFLYLIGLLNLVVLVSIIKVSREMRQGRYDDDELERQLESRGLMNRVLGGYAKRIDTPWKMYPVGVLFGLGLRHRHRGRAAGARRIRRRRRAALLRRDRRSRSSSPPACASSTPSTGAS